MVDLHMRELEARRAQITTELQQVEAELLKLRQANCSRCGDTKTITVSGGLYGAQPIQVSCPVCT